MTEMNNLEKVIMGEKPDRCQICGKRLTYKGAGRYVCDNCQTEVLDDFGKIKEYLDSHGPTPAVTIAKATGVDRDTINYYLRKGRVEITEGSKYYLNCERCGCSIRYGRYCPDCVREADRRGYSLRDEMGERPRRLR